MGPPMPISNTDQAVSLASTRLFRAPRPGEPFITIRGKRQAPRHWPVGAFFVYETNGNTQYGNYRIVGSRHAVTLPERNYLMTSRHRHPENTEHDP